MNEIINIERSVGSNVESRNLYFECYIGETHLDHVAQSSLGVLIHGEASDMDVVTVTRGSCLNQ
jgi:hypothetical protein